MFNTFDIKNISIIGLGYVGLPLAIEFDNYYNVIGFDIDKQKINSYKNGIDVTFEVGDDKVLNSNIIYTDDEAFLKKANFHIVAVPTPIDENKKPNLKPLISASEILARNLTKGSIVVYESTVYPGLTEEICIPILEKISNLNYPNDFKVGYSPERINPADKTNRLSTIVKIVSGCDDIALDIIANVYSTIIKAGVYKSKDIKTAEASKILENSQRDINIAFINELSIMFKLMDIDIDLVLDGCKTKWNFLNFSPGLVGGNCIGVDPYYLIQKSCDIGYSPNLMITSRQINDSMPIYVVDKIIRTLIKQDIKIKNSTIGVFGTTFKENCPDCSNSKIFDIVNLLLEYNINIKIFDPVCDKDEVLRKLNINTSTLDEMNNLDCIIFGVCHDEFYELFNLDKLKSLYKADKYILFDIKGMFKDNILDDFVYWKL